MLAASVTAVAVVMAGCGGTYARTEVLRSANPRTSDIYLRITGPGGAVHYVAGRFRRAAFDRFNFHETTRSEKVFLPPRIEERKLCGSTHVIKRYDAPQLQEWRGKTLAISIYGRKDSQIYCAVLTGNLYLAAS